MKSRSVKILLAHLTLIATLLSFQNCSQPFKSSTESSQTANNVILENPQIIFSDSSEFINSSAVTIQFSVAVPTGDSIQSVVCQIGDSAAQDCRSGSITYNNLIDGNYVVIVTALTTQGRRSEETRTIRKDTTAPLISVSLAPPAVSSSLSAAFTFTVSDSFSGVQTTQCSLDNAAFANCVSSENLSNLSVGAHNYRIRSLDRAGNMSNIYSYSWTINQSAPTVTIASAPSSFTNTTTASISFSGSNIVSYQCQVDDGAFTNCTSPRALSNLTANAAHIFRVRGTSSTGVLSANSEARWTVDTVTPSTPQLTASVTALTQERSASISFLSNDSLSGIARFECSLNSGSFATCTNPRALSNLSDGQHTFAVRAVDNAGNTSQVGNFSWRVDITAPTLAFSQTPSTSSTSTTASFSFSASDAGSGMASIQCSLNTAAFANCTSPVSLSNLTFAPQQYRVRATDLAGNQTLITHNWTVTEVVTPPPSGNIQAAIAATRVTGVAPLAVHFDATASTGVAVPFHFLRYEFDFGDDRGLNWAVSGLSKNTQSGGPIAAHVFDNPGTYNVRVRVRNPLNNESSDATISITVQDPNAVFSGTNTICVSTSSNFSGCPAGAAQQASVPSIQSNKRILLRRGESFGNISISHGISNVQIAAYGAGNKPRIGDVNIGEMGPPNNSFPSDISTFDLNIQRGYSQNVTGSRILLYRCDFDVPQGEFLTHQITIAAALSYIASNHTLALNQYYQPREIFVVENTVFGSLTNPLVNMVGEGSRFVIMGNRMGVAQQHTIRLWTMHKGFIAHNHLRGISSDGIRVALKLHSGGLGDYNDNYAISGSSWASRQVIIANNLFGDPADNNSFTGGAGPQNTESQEGLEDIILENNRFYRGPNTNTEFILMGRRMTTRGNTRMDGGIPNINQFDNQYQLIPASWNGPYYIQ